MKKTQDIKTLIQQSFDRLDSQIIRKPVIWSIVEKIEQFKKTGQPLKWEHFSQEERAALEYSLAWLKIHFYNEIYYSKDLSSDTGLSELIRIYKENIYKINQYLRDILAAGTEFPMQKTA